MTENDNQERADNHEHTQAFEAAGRHPSSSAEELDVAVVGGGIAGLYCCWRLLDSLPEAKVTLFEATNRCGGRIESVVFKEHGDLLAEMGPMRILPYPDRHKLLCRLVGQLNSRAPDSPDILYTNFPSYTQEPIPAHERKHLPIGVEGLNTPLDVMKYGLIRIVKPKLLEHADWAKRFQDWVDAIPFSHFPDATDPPREFRNARELADVAQQYSDDGFWNVLANVMSHDAVRLVLEKGALLHQFPENPNAADAIIHWVRAMQSHGGYKGIDGGFECLAQKLRAFLEAHSTSRFEICTDHKLVEIIPSASGDLRLGFGDKAAVNEFHHLVLALPPKPLLALRGLDAIFPKKVLEALRAVFAFPLLKAFFVLERPFWTEERQPNQYQDRLPARELHYRRQYRLSPKDSDHGIILVYADRPACKFWSPYASNQKKNVGVERCASEIFQDATEGMQDATEDSWIATSAETDSLPKPQRSKLLSRIVQYLHENGLEDFQQDRIKGYAIRDWECSSVGGANHAWEVGAKSWDARNELKAFGNPGQQNNKQNIHICGEAYSDYQGFIEGALRSVELALTTIIWA